MFPEARLEPLGENKPCRCDKREDALAIEAYMTEGNIAAEWKGRMGHKITDDIMELLDNYYTYGQCGDCRDREESHD